MIALRRLRLDAGLRPEELAALSGVSAETIRNLESRRITNPHVSTLTGLAAALAARPSELLLDSLPSSNASDVAA